nr:hypothetical protein [Candidatus Thiosymbion oneisti]
MADRLRDAADIAGHDGHTGTRRLEQGYPQPLPGSGMDQQLQAGQQIRQVLPEPGELHMTLESRARNTPTQVLLQGTLAEDE